MTQNLYHFSDRPDISQFVPRPLAVPSARPAGMDWLNGPLVWAIDAVHQPLYLFPRNCPRILIWASDQTSAQDRFQYKLSNTLRMAAYVEEAWLRQIATTTLWRYRLPSVAFIDLKDAGMFVTKSQVTPVEVTPICDLPAALKAEQVDLRPLPTLSPLRSAWQSTLHVSGIRLRHAEDF